MMDIPLLFIETSVSLMRDLHPKRTVSEVPNWILRPQQIHAYAGTCKQNKQTEKQQKPCSCYGAHEPVELQFAGEHGVASGRFGNPSKGAESARCQLQ